MMKHWSIRTRVLFLALAPTTLVVVTLASLLTHFRTVEIAQSLEQRSAASARHVARASEFGLFSGDRRILQRVADDACTEADVESVEIFNADGQLMAQSGQPRSAVEGAQPLVNTEPVLQSILQFSDLPESTDTAPGARLGEVRVQMSRMATENAIHDGWILALLLGSGCLVVATAVGLGIGRGVSDPILRLGTAIRAIAGGDFSVRVDPATGGELLALAHGINQMAAALGISQKELESRIAQATQQLQLQKQAAEEANRAKSRFLASASHDLRQPLHAIELFAAALHRKVRGREARELSEKLEQAIFSMDALFNSLLDIYQLDAGVLKPAPRAFPVQELLDRLETEFRGDANGRGLRLRIVPSVMAAFTDPVLAHRVLANLLTNALRYTPVGTVMVACRRDVNGLRLEVRDTGRGIAPQEQQNIFREFYRVAGGEHDRAMGMGLTIVSRIAALLGSNVRVRSEVGRGSVFSIVFPRHVDVAPALAQDRLQTQPLFTPHLGVLIVDNDPLILQSTLSLTREWGIGAVTASGVEEARAALRTLPQETIFVLSDLWLSNQENGLDLLLDLTRKGGRRIFGAIVTGDTNPETAARVQAAGFPVLLKPVSAAKLRATFMYYRSKAEDGPRTGE